MNKSSNEKISEVLGIEPIPAPIETLTDTKAEIVVPAGSNTAITVTSNKSLDDNIVDEDFAEARENLKTIIEKSDEAITDLQIVARETESPRAYEVLATLLKQAAEANKDLMGLSKIRKELTKTELRRGEPSSSPAHPSVTNIQQAVFVGSTADLTAMITKAQKGEIIDVTEKDKDDDVLQ